MKIEKYASETGKYNPNDKVECLETIQKVGKLNEIYPIDKRNEKNNAYHIYSILAIDKKSPPQFINFQNGGRNEEGSTHGVLDVDLLEICLHRLKSFQDGQFACKENEEAISHLTKVLEIMNKRVEDRIARGVLGKQSK